MYRMHLIIFLTLLNKIGSGGCQRSAFGGQLARRTRFIVRIAAGQLLAIARKSIGMLSPIFSD
jgi:hypothetical protein